MQLMGIACGVAAVVGMVLSSRAALDSFSRAVGFLGGHATHSLRRPAGSMDDTVLEAIMIDPAVRGFSPVIDRRVKLENGDLVRFLGIDPFLDGALRPNIVRQAFHRKKDGADQALEFITGGNRVLLDEGLARELKAEKGDWITTSRGRFLVSGIFPNPTGETVMVMDISGAVEVFGLHGRIDRVDLILEDEDGFRSRWEDGFVIQTSRQRRETLEAMLSAFRLNLLALSLLALFVGMFLIYNTAMFAVISRRKDAGILMSLGAGRRDIVAAFFAEMLVLGSLGGAFGGIMGYILNRFLTNLIGGTISNLYFFIKPRPFEWSLWIPVAGIVLGCLATFLGAVYPLLELVRTDPVVVLRGRIPQRKGLQKSVAAAAAGGGMLLVSFMLLLMADYHVYFGFAGAFGLLSGMSMLTGLCIIAMAPVTKRILSVVGGLPGKVSAGFIRQNLNRTAVAVAAFMVALSMSIGLSSMIGSFRNSLIWWMGTQISAEMYVGSSADVTVPEDFYEEIKDFPGVGGVDVFRNVQTSYRGAPVYVAAIDPVVLQKYTDFGWLEGGDENWEPVKQGAVVISESFWRRFGIDRGDSVTLEGIEGPVSLRVAGVFYDYTSEHGLVMIDRMRYLEIFGDRAIASIGVFIDQGNPMKDEIIQEVKKRAVSRGLPVKTRQEFHNGILAVFDNTFAVTRSMRVLAIIIALFGIAGALLTLFMERQREFGIYRALGFSSKQVAGMTLMEGLGLGLLSLVLASVTGTLLAYVLIKVINLHSFNWTIFFYPSWKPYVLALLTAVAASIISAAYPIYRIYRTYPQMQIRED